MKADFNIIKEHIQKYSYEHDVIFINGPGNWGDAIIRAGTLKYFHENAIHFIEIPYRNLINQQHNLARSDLRKVFRDKTLIFSGGGAWCDWFKTAYEFIKHFHIYFKYVIVLPSTYGFYFESENIIYFSRDKLQSIYNNPKSIFCHDMAFFLDRFYIRDKSTIKRGYFFRTDKEASHKINIPFNNKDISLNGIELTPIEKFVTTINQYEYIDTDRLHVAIVASLLGKKVQLFPGRYFKNEAIYRSSLSENFANITFVN